jgi:hypothetical protein
MARRAQWVAVEELAPGYWIIDPHCGSHARVAKIEKLEGATRIDYDRGPPGRLGCQVPDGREICQMVRTGGRKAKGEG